MTRNPRKANGPARPIRTKRDFDSAAAIVKRMSRQTHRDSAAELRLQSLLEKLEEFDDTEDDTSADVEDTVHSGPRRRWSDDTSGAD